MEIHHINRRHHLQDSVQQIIGLSDACVPLASGKRFPPLSVISEDAPLDLKDLLRIFFADGWDGFFMKIIPRKLPSTI